MSWPLVKLQDLVEINIGRTPSRDNPDYWGKGVSWLSIRDMNQGKYLSKTAEQITELAIKETNCKIAKKGTVLFSFKLSIGKVGFAEVDMFHNEAIAAMPIKKGVALCEEYFYFSLLQMDSSKSTDRAAMGATLNKKKMAELVIPLPPLALQKKIAAVLEKADQLRKDCQQMEQELNSLAQSVFIDMFGDPVTNPKGWEIGTIGELLSSANYGTSEKSSTEILQYPVLRMNNLTYEGNWDFTSLKYMDMPEKDEEKYLVRDGDILFNRTNSKELVGKTAVYRESEPMAYAGYLVRARCNELAHPDYISSFMNSKYGKQTLQSMCKSIVGMANINAKEFQGVNIAKPPVELQLEFSARVSKIRALVQETKLQYIEYQDNFNALMQQAFNGELNLTDAPH